MLCKQGFGEREDIAQDLWLALVRAAKRYSPEKGSAHRFAGCVITRAVIDIVRRHDKAAGMTGGAQPESDLEELEDSTEAEVRRYLDLEQSIERALAAMPKDIRGVCRLLCRGKSQDAIAEILGITRREVRRRMDAAKQYLAVAAVIYTRWTPQ
jgi:RNA polymerase sigma factor (sigma-70 family)